MGLVQDLCLWLLLVFGMRLLELLWSQMQPPTDLQLLTPSLFPEPPYIVAIEILLLLVLALLRSISFSLCFSQ